MQTTIMKGWQIVVFTLGLLLFGGEMANAAPVTIKITGVVTSVRDLEDYPYSDTVYEGVPFSGTYTYDDATLNTSVYSDIGIYTHDSPYGFNISVGGFEFKTAETHTAKFSISVYNDYSSDTYDRIIIESSQNEYLSTGLIVNGISWDIYDGTHSAISSTDLQSTPPNLAAWESNTLSIGCGSGGNATFAVWGTVTEAVLVPEPATMLLLGLGGLFLHRKATAGKTCG